MLFNILNYMTKHFGFNEHLSAGTVAGRVSGCWSSTRFSELDNEEEVSNQQTQNLQRKLNLSACDWQAKCYDSMYRFVFVIEIRTRKCMKNIFIDKKTTI